MHGKKDLHHGIKAVLGLAPKAAVTNDTAFVSEIADRAGFEAVEFVGIFGSVADSDVTFTVLVEHGDTANLTDAAAVPDGQLLGVEAMSLRYDSDDKVWKIGYIGPKRYVRVTVTPADNTGNIFLAGAWLLGSPRSQPQATQVN